MIGTDPPLTIRTGKGYNIDFAIDLGQRNARFRRGVLTPLRRLVRWGDAVTWLPRRSTDVIHSFNAVPLTRKPYLITFEDYLPRTPPDRHVAWVERALRPLLLDDSCRALIALSDFASRQFRRQHRACGAESALAAKIEVLHPAVRQRADGPKPDPGSKQLRLLFVGSDFMRKGGPAVLRAHEALRRAGVPVETTVVSSLRWTTDDYIGPPDRRVVQEQIERLYQPGVRHLPGLNNTAALELMERAAFLLLPTLHDTFGYVSLEAMAAGTPVIATATCALPEVVEDGVSGHLLALDNDPDVGKWVWTIAPAPRGIRRLTWRPWIASVARWLAGSGSSGRVTGRLRGNERAGPRPSRQPLWHRARTHAA